MNRKALFTRIIALFVLGAGFVLLTTQTSFAGPQLPSGGGASVTTPIYMGSEDQVRTGPLGILVSSFLSGTKFEVLGRSTFENGVSILNNSLIINGPTKVGNPSTSANFNLMGGNLIISDAGSQPNGFSPSNTQISTLVGPTTSPICATQSGQLVRC